MCGRVLSNRQREHYNLQQTALIPPLWNVRIEWWLQFKVLIKMESDRQRAEPCPLLCICLLVLRKKEETKTVLSSGNAMLESPRAIGCFLPWTHLGTETNLWIQEKKRVLKWPLHTCKLSIECLTKLLGAWHFSSTCGDMPQFLTKAFNFVS